MSSRYDQRYRHRGRETKGHGCLGFFLTLIIVGLIVGGIFFFMTGDRMDGLKGKVYSVFYPQKYSEQVSRYSSEFGVEEALVYSVIRTESGFRPEVESHAGAVGLMQLMPSTFDWLQEKLEGSVVYTSEQLKDPDTNIKYGTYFLSMLMDRYGGDIKTVAAAYNAGTTTVDGWLSDTTYSTNGTTLSYIPYEETEHYADKVIKTRDMYNKLYYQSK